MMELREYYRLKKQLEVEYNLEGAGTLAAELIQGGATELTDTIREKIEYLQKICEIDSLDNYWVCTLVANYTLDEIEARYEFYRHYAGKERCKVDSLALTCEKGNAYLTLFKELGFTSEQMNNAMKKVVENGSIMKAEMAVRSTIRDLSIFEMADDERNQFISDHADFLFNDFSVDTWPLFANLCQRFGREGGVACLIEHPEYLRLGVEEKTLRDKVLDYLYNNEAVFFHLRDGVYEKPNGTEILLEFAREVHSRVKENASEVSQDIIFLLDIIFTLMEFSQETEWTNPLAAEIREIIVGFSH